MKKLFSFFTTLSVVFSKRLGIIIFLMMYVSLLFAGNAYYQPNATVSAAPVGAGSVYVSITEGDKTSQSADGKYGANNDKDAHTTFYFYVDHTNNDYLWYRWENQKGTEVNKNKNHSLSLAYSSGSTHGGTTGSYKITETQNGQSGESDVMTYTMPFTAKWVQPDVTGVTNGTANGTRRSTYDLGTVTNPTATTNNVAFTLSNDYAGLLDKNDVCPDYYSVATPLASNGYTNGNISHTKGSGSLTVPVIYTPTGVHGQTNSASLTVKSNYPSAGTNCWTAVFSIAENYKPEFSLSTTNYNFTPNYPIDNSTSSSAYTLPITGRNYAASNIAEWDVSWGTVTYEGGTYPNANPYSLDVTDINNPKVIFTAPATGSYTDVTVTLTITAKYKDANGTFIASDAKTITFSADAGNILKIGDLSAYTMDFGIVDFGTAVSKEVALISTYSDLTETRSNEVAGITLTPDYANDKITVSIANTTAIGSHTPSLTLKAGTEASAVLNVTAQVKLAKPVVTATTGLGQSIDLSWSAVNGATSYIVKSGATVVATIDDDEAIATTYKVVSIGGQSLVMGTEYPFTVTAVYESNAFGNRTSDEITVKPTAPATITATTELDLYTGTEKYQEGHTTDGKYPYAPKRKIDLSAAFNNGVAAFDQLFVFGLTLGDAEGKITKPAKTTNSNALTPCYIYTKSGNNYTLSSTIENVNVATKPTAFNIDANGQKIYFTGYAPYASCGSTWDENAVFLFTGNGKSVDVYFDNLELYARPKAATGTTTPTKEYTVSSFSEALSLMSDPDVNLNISNTSLDVYVQGSGAAFAFASTGGTLTPTIHLNGTNVLQSTTGVSVHVNCTYLLTIDATASQQSSPIQVLTKKDGGSATLTITDTWFDTNTHTNGILDLAKSGVRPAPTIDLGNPNTTLNFNGGQYFLANAGNTSTSYTVSYAISYRKKSMKEGLANMYGVGDDYPEGKVRFNDGSVSCAELPISYFNEDLYHNRTSMKCPQDTKIDGGTFNCDVLSCSSTTSKGGSPTNRDGKSLCKVPIPIESTNSNGTAVLANDWMTYAANHGANTSDLGYYGIKTMQPTTITNDDNEEVPGVNLMLPSDNVCFMEVNRTPWVLCAPTVSVTTSMGNASMGGSKDVPSSVTAGDEGLTHVQLTSRLFYGELDSYIAEVANSGYQTPGGMSVDLPDGEGNQYVLNTESYVIKDKIYWVRPVVANEWRMLVPPFDVANIYIVEAYPEQQLLADFGDGETISGEDAIYEARLAQATRMMDFIYYWLYDVDPVGLGNDNDLWPRYKYEKMGAFVQDWVNYEVETYGEAHKPTIDQLYHFTGNNWDANYYLYESDGKWDYVDGKFVTDWQLVSTQSVERGKGTPQTIMHKGGIYSMCFPYSIYNDGSHNPDVVWDYWTGKYIIMEGYPTEEVDIIGSAQVLSGTTSDWNGNALTTTILADHTATGASLRGNHTFGQVDVQKNNAFYLNGTNKYTNPSTSTKRSLEPGEGFLLANAGTAPLSMPNRKASIDLMSGVVTYEPMEGTEDAVTGTPTISGEREMLVYTVAGGLGVVPVVSQYVSIYNAAGQLVVSQYLTDEMQFALPAGIYLVRGEKEQAKVMVK